MLVKSVNVLLIEDNPGDARLVKEELRSIDSKITVQLEWVNCLEKGLERLDSNSVQAILLDLSLPDSEGLETLAAVRSRAPQIPVIVMTGQTDEQVGMKALQAGAQDYLIKGQVDGRLLSRVIQYAIQRKQTEMQLADVLVFTEQVLTSSPVGILTYKFTGECLSANACVTQMFGATTEELRSQNFRELDAWKQSGLYQMAENAIASNQLTAGDVFIPTAPDKQLWLRAQMVTFKSGEGNVLLLTLVDITESKKADETLRAMNEEIKVMSQQLWQAARLATMGELAASVAHELNNPLATVSLRTEMLLSQFPADDPRIKPLQIIEAEVKRMSSLVANLLSFSRRGQTAVSTTDLNEEVIKTLDLMQHQLRNRQVRVIHELNHETPLVRVDRQQLRQVFLNLFTNAGDAMPNGGTLKISIREDQGKELTNAHDGHFSLNGTLGLPVSPPPYVRIEISDTGEGIPPDALNKVWEPFYTTKLEGKGTGLGMGICQRIVQEHGGLINIISEGLPGRGTTVTVLLPAHTKRDLYAHT